ncbi:MAG: DegQ family serine endoprotease [Rhodoferax sp.]|nr:DegQ family serine endoprotease [Rhodoferax sp.]
MHSTKRSLYAKASFVGVLTASCFLGGYALSQRSPASAPGASTPATMANPHLNARGAPPAGFADIAERQGPAVVNISVQGMVKTTARPGAPQLDPRDPFYEFFRRFQPPVQQDDTPTRGAGSGFIVKADGVVLTNAHVVADASEVTVKLKDKREFKAKVVGMDKLSDVAVLKINTQDLPTVQIGDPQSSRVGDWVVAIGSPFGFENTVTAGVVSAKSRTLPDESYVPFLQTDVAINPGNSGGPLFNMAGEVIGINSQIYSRSGGYQGLSFAIPIDVAMKVEGQLLAHGSVRRGRLGVTIQEVSPELAESFGLDAPAGALVNSVDKGSAADKAGLQVGDVILTFNGTAITQSSELPPLVSDSAPGTQAQVRIWRQGKAQELRMTLGQLEADKVATAPAAPQEKQLGLAVRPLNRQERSEAQVTAGLLVEGVADGPAKRAGLRSGDVILSVNGALAESADTLKAQLGHGRKKLALLVLRGEDRLFVPLTVG